VLSSGRQSPDNQLAWKTMLMIETIDMQRSEEVRRTLPYLRDRRIDVYDDLLLSFRDQ